MYSTNILKFWLESIANSNLDEIWIKNHNLRVILDQITLVIMLNRDASSLHELSEFYFIQSKKLCPAVNLAVEEIQYSPNSSIIEFYTPKEGACYYPWMTFYGLFDLSLQSLNSWNAIGKLLVSRPLSISAKELLKKEGISKDLFWNSLIRKWANVVLYIDPANPLIAIYWQMFFTLYFSKCAAPFGAGNESGIFGYRLLEGNSGNSLKNEVISRLIFLIDYFSKIQLEIKVKQLNLPKFMEMILNLFKAMLLWIKALNPAELVYRQSIEILPSRLFSLVNEPILNNKAPCLNNLWWDLVNTTSVWNSLEYSCFNNFKSIRIIFGEEFKSILEPMLDLSISNKKFVDPILYPFLYPSLISSTNETDIKNVSYYKIIAIDQSRLKSSESKTRASFNFKTSYLSQFTIGIIYY